MNFSRLKPISGVHLNLKPKFTHFLNATLFLLQIGMHIQIKRCRDIRMPQHRTHRFIVTLALYAPSRKSMPKVVKDNRGNLQPTKQPSEVIAIGSWGG